MSRRKKKEHSRATWLGRAKRAERDTLPLAPCRGCCFATRAKRASEHSTALCSPAPSSPTRALASETPETLDQPLRARVRYRDCSLGSPCLACARSGVRAKRAIARHYARARHFARRRSSKTRLNFARSSLTERCSLDQRGEARPLKDKKLLFATKTHTALPSLRS